MTATEPDTPTPGPADPLIEGLLALAHCVGEALPDICSYGLTIGESYVPFDPDEDEECEAEDVQCSQAWVRVIDVTPFGQVEAFGGDSCSVDLRVQVEVGVLRCIEIRDGGEAPTTSDVMTAAAHAMNDMAAIQCAALNCSKTGDDGIERPVWDRVMLGTWAPLGPLGGQYGGSWSMTLEI